MVHRETECILAIFLMKIDCSEFKGVYVERNFVGVGPVYSDGDLYYEKVWDYYWPDASSGGNQSSWTQNVAKGLYFASSVSGDLSNWSAMAGTGTALLSLALEVPTLGTSTIGMGAAGTLWGVSGVSAGVSFVTGVNYYFVLFVDAG